MASPISGSPFLPPEGPTIVVIDVASPAVFVFMRGLVNVIHSTHIHMEPSQRGPSQDHSFRPIVSNVPTVSDLIDDLADQSTAASNGPSARPLGGRGSAPIPADPAVRSPEEAHQQEQADGNLPPDFKVPDLTDHSLPRDDKAKYQRILADMLDRIARLVREMSIAKEAVKQDIRQDMSQSDQDRQAAIKNEITRLKQNIADSKAGIQAKGGSELSDDDAKQVGLIIESRGEDGSVEQISVEKGEISDLLQNLEGILASDDTQKILDGISSKATSSSATDNPAMGDPAAAQKSQREGAQGPGVRPGSEHGANLQQKMPPAQTISQPIAGAVAASYMPYQGQKLDRPENLSSEDSYRIEDVEKTSNVRPSDRENKEAKESERRPEEGAVAAKVSRKGAHRKEVQEAVDAASKEHKAKKPAVAQRMDDRGIIPVHGKFTVEHLKNIRRRGAREGGAGGGQADTHRLIDVFYMILCAVVCGSHSVFDIAAFIESREKWFSTVLGLRGGVPSARLINRLIGSFNPNQISEMLAVWMQEAQGAPSRTGLATMVMGETFEGLIFAQEKSGVPSSAEACMPRILQFFDLKGLVIMLSQGKASKKAAEKIARSGAHYIYDCGEEPFAGEEEVLPLFAKSMADPKSAPEVHHTESYVEGQEFLQLYEVKVDNAPDYAHSTAQLLAEVHSAQGKEEAVQYFTSSLPKQSVYLFDLLRTQRALEGKTFWMMNMSMRGKSADDAALSVREFIALVRRYSAGLLLRDQTFMAPLHVKQQRAAREPEYLMKLLKLAGV